VIIVNDGSIDDTAKIAGEYDMRLINTENRGLASARNAGLYASTGEIVAYIDADAGPDPHWLSHLAVSFVRSSHVGVGGPNIPPPGEGTVAQCVANAPGGPTHVLLSDQEAEHIPGCNMAFRKASLEAIGGFDPLFRVAGDDVDICWQLQDRGWTVGYSAGAVVWHHRRGSVKGYLKQQFEYGKAEALLERKWPERYNRVGHLAWAGRVYGNGATKALGWRRWKIYYGRWGTGLFQSVYKRAPGPFTSLSLVPEWYLVITCLAALSALGILWSPLLLALPLLALATGSLVLESTLGATRSSFRRSLRSRFERFYLRSLVALLYMLQPLVRLSGRLRYGLAPWRRRSGPALAFPRRRTSSIWSEGWQSSDERLLAVEHELKQAGCTVLHGSAYDRWDLQVRGGMLGVARMRIAVEEHGGGNQLVRFHSWPKFSRFGLALMVMFGALAAGAVFDGAVEASIVLGALAALVGGSVFQDCATAVGNVLRAIDRQSRGGEVESAASEHAPAIAPGDVLQPAADGHENHNGRVFSPTDNGHDAEPASTPVADLRATPDVVPFSPRHE
jgi:GT2 family glycosyltransferase